MVIVRVPITHLDAQALVEDVQEAYVGIYGGRDETPLEDDYFDAPQGAFFVGYLEETAREHGATDLILETGAPQTAAIGLYESAGYTPVPPFGHYRCAPDNRCFARSLAGGVPQISDERDRRGLA